MKSLMKEFIHNHWPSQQERIDEAPNVSKMKLLTPMDEVHRLTLHEMYQLHTVEILCEFDEDVFNAVSIQLYQEVNREK